VPPSFASKSTHGYHGFSAFRPHGAGHPGELNQLVLNEPQEAAVMGVPLRCNGLLGPEFGFKVKRRAGGGDHLH